MLRSLAGLSAGLLLVAAAPAQADATFIAQTKPIDQGPTNSVVAPADPLGGLTLGVGASSWSGDYGGPTNTSISAALLTARYALGDLRLSASIPYTRIKSAGAVFTGIGGTPLIVSPLSTASKVTRDGLGDVTLGAAYFLPTAASLGVDLELIGRVKLPTASNSSLSTNKTDFSFGGEVSRSFGKFVPFASLTYRSFGSDSEWKLKDGVATSVGTTWLINDRFVGSFSYDYAQRASRFIQDSHEFVASLSSKLWDTKIRLTGFASAGLSSGAADVSGGLALSTGF